MATVVADNPVDVQPPAVQTAAAPVTPAAPVADQTPVQSQAVATPAPAPAPAPTTAPIAAQMRAVDPATETTSGQLNSILSNDSPLMQRARTLATQQMAQKGLVNSSMAAGAGEAAMIDHAAPIAQADASVYDTRARAQMDASNALLSQDKTIAAQMAAQKDQQTFTSGETALDRTQQTNIAQLQVEAQKQLVLANQAFSAAQSTMDRDQQTAMVKLQASLNDSAVSRTFAANTATSTLSAINAIQADGTLKPEAKKAAIDNIIATANSTMQWGATFYNTALPTVTKPGTTSSTLNPTGMDLTKYFA